MTALIRWKRHLSEARLFECYLAEQNGEGISPPDAEHLADCRGCHTRYAELARFMDEVWQTADAEAAAIFTPDRLLSQQHEIARRLELLGHAGRVLSFRAAADHRQLAEIDETAGRLKPALSRTAAGWVAAAAVAGMFIGVGAGRLYDGGARSVPATGAAIAPPIQVVEPVNVAAPDMPDEDLLFLSELEAALSRPRTPELVALDAMTPRAREIGYRIR
jgi:hypothetical protein